MTQTDAYIAARPGILVGGQNMTTISEGLRELSIVENTAGLYRCEALFGNWGNANNTLDFLYFDRKALDFGKTFEVKFGTDTIFSGRIMALEAHFPEGGPPELNVLAEDRFQDLRMTRRTRTFVNVSDADVISQIANEHGLSPSVDVRGPTYKILAQVNQSDLAFLRERARAIDAELWMDGNTLHAASHSKRNDGTLRLAYGRELRAFSVLADLSRQYSSVIVSGWDVASKEGLRHEASDDILSGELQGDTSGAHILSTAIGQRKEVLAHTTPLNSQEAQATAEAFFKMNARRFVVGNGEATPDSHLRVGSYVELLNLGPLFSGKYYLSEVQHVFHETCGISTEFTAERPGLGSTQ